MKYLSTLLLFTCFVLPSTPANGQVTEDGFVSLFDGTSLAGWEGKPEFWSVQDGAITGQTTAANPTKGNTFLIWRDGKLADFELRLKFKIVGGNSGIQYRAQDHGDFVVGGYQADFEAGETYSGILYEERGRGILAQRGQVTQVTSEAGKAKVNVVGSIGDTQDINSVIKREDWNDYVIIARGNQLTHIINGRVTVMVTDDDPAKAASAGILALQVHAGPPMKVQFKDIRVKHHDPISDLPSIFNGRDFTGWKAPENNLWWKAVDGVLQVKSGPEQKGQTLWTERDYTNFVMKFDFRLGEGTVDTGIYVRNAREQIQIGISGSLKRDMTGSPYIAGKGYPVEGKGVKEILSLDDWNSMTIVAIGKNYTVFLNGKHVMTYDSETAIESGPVGIQLHGSRDMSCDYRNIKLSELH